MPHGSASVLPAPPQHLDDDRENDLSTGPDDVPRPEGGPPTHWDSMVRPPKTDAAKRTTFSPERTYQCGSPRDALRAPRAWPALRFYRLGVGRAQVRYLPAELRASPGTKLRLVARHTDTATLIG